MKLLADRIVDMVANISQKKRQTTCDHLFPIYSGREIFAYPNF